MMRTCRKVECGKEHWTIALTMKHHCCYTPKCGERELEAEKKCLSSVVATAWRQLLSAGSWRPLTGVLQQRFDEVPYCPLSTSHLFSPPFSLSLSFPPI